MSENETSEKGTRENEQQTRVQYGRHMLWLSGIVGAVLGAVLCAALIFGVVLPARVILTYESRVGFDETVEALERSVRDSGWVVSSVMDMNKAVAGQNSPLQRRVKLVSMCKPEYAEILLRTDPAVAAMMPCTFAVWEGREGKVHISKTNMALMARTFGGNAADVMGRRVAWDEKIILGDIVKGE